MEETNKLKKDSPMMRSDISVDRDAWLRDLSDEGSRDLCRRLIERDVDLYQHPEKEEEYETYGADGKRRRLLLRRSLRGEEFCSRCEQWLSVSDSRKRSLPLANRKDVIVNRVFIRFCVLIVCAFLSQAAFCSLVISDLKLTPIEPIGLAIDYTVKGVTVNDVGGWVVSVTMVDGNKTYVAKTLAGDTSCLNGAHRVYWNVAKDGITLGKADVDVTVAYKYFPLYCVIDLSKGSSATSYPVTYLDAPPSGGFNTTESKTTKLVLKRVDAGTFTMGNASENDNETHTVTLTKPFYMGLYEVTQKQWELVMGSNPCSSTSYGKGNAYPVHYVSYDMIRGSSEGAKWPTSNLVDSDSFLGKLRAKTGIDFDLPTEAQWEYTCRAGTTTKYSYGDSVNGNYMWYILNSSSSSHEVGTKKANPWGFYDMHCNVEEWCLDWYNLSLSGGVDPAGSSSGSRRVLRGAGWDDVASICTSSYRYNCSWNPSLSNDDYGFRLSRTLP